MDHLLVSCGSDCQCFFRIQLYISLDKFGGSYISDLLCRCEHKLTETDAGSIDNLGNGFVSHALYSNVLDIFRVIGHRLPQMIGSLFIVIPSIAIACHYSSLVSLFLLVSFILGVAVSYYSRRKIYMMTRATNNKLKTLHNLINEFSGNIGYSKRNRLSLYYERMTRNDTSSFIQSSAEQDKSVYFYSESVNQMNVFLQIVFAMVLSFASAEQSIVNVVVYTMVYSLVMNQGSEIEQLLQQINRSMICFSNIRIILSLPAHEETEVVDHIEDIDCSAVSFSYREGNAPSVQNVNFHAAEGDCIRLEGVNGSGKSSIIKLLTKEYETYSGMITINGIDLRRIKKESLLERTLVLSQDEPLLNETIFDYLRIVSHRPECSDEQIEAVLSQLNLGDVPERIENNGGNLSNGQRKKLLMAKLMLGKESKDLILLDEVDSGLDVHSRELYESYVNDLIDEKKYIIMVVQHSRNSAIHYTKSVLLSEDHESKSRNFTSRK